MAMSKEQYTVATTEDICFMSMINPSCSSITILGQLLLLSKDQDFRLVDAGTCNHNIKHPDSFRASLMHLIQECWSAFNTAERNMNRVLQNVKKLPNEFKTIHEVLTSGKADDISCLLPCKLRMIKSSSNKCVKFTRECQDTFVNVMKLIDEISRLCISKDNSLSNKKQENEVTKVMLENMKKMLEKEKEQIEKDKRAYAASMKSAQAQYDKAVSDLPSDALIASSMLGSIVQDALPVLPMFLVQSNTATAGLVAAAQSVALAKGKNSDPQGATISNLGTSAVFDQVQGGGDIYKTCLDKMLLIARQMLRWIDNGTLKGTDGREGHISVLFMLQNLPEHGNRIIGVLVEDVLSICTRVKDLAEGMPNEEREAAVIADIKKFHSKVESLKERNQAQTDMQGATAQEPTSHTIQSNLGLVLESRHRNLEIAERRLADQEKRYDKLRDERRENAKKMTEMMNKLAELDVDTISVTELRKTLVEAMALFIQIREQWGLLTRYFQFLADMVADELDNEVENLQSTADSVKGKEIEGAKRKCLEEIMSRADDSIKQTQQFASFYVTASRRYLMPSLSNVFQIEATAAGRTQDQRKQMQIELSNTYKTQVEEITEMAENMSMGGPTLEPLDGQ